MGFSITMFQFKILLALLRTLCRLSRARGAVDAGVGAFMCAYNKAGLCCQDILA